MAGSRKRGVAITIAGGTRKRGSGAEFFLGVGESISKLYFFIKQSIPLYALGSISVTNAYSQANSLTSSKFWNRTQTSVRRIIVNLIFIFF